MISGIIQPGKIETKNIGPIQEITGEDLFPKEQNQEQKQINVISLLTKKNPVSFFHTCFTAQLFDTNKKNAKKNFLKKVEKYIHYVFWAGCQCEYNTPVPSDMGENW